MRAKRGGLRGGFRADATLAANAARVSANAVSAATARARLRGGRLGVQNATVRIPRGDVRRDGRVVDAHGTHHEWRFRAHAPHDGDDRGGFAEEGDGSDARFAKYDDVAYSTKSWPSALASAW